MSLTTFVQIFLVVDVFFIGALSAIGYRHAMMHFRPEDRKSVV